MQKLMQARWVERASMDPTRESNPTESQMTPYQDCPARQETVELPVVRAVAMRQICFSFLEILPWPACKEISSTIIFPIMGCRRPRVTMKMTGALKRLSLRKLRILCQYHSSGAGYHVDHLLRVAK